MINNLLQNTSVHDTADIIGHRDIQSTMTDMHSIKKKLKTY